jgi:hypothetical protein
LNDDQVRLNRIHFSRGNWPTMFTSLHFIHPAIGRLTRMRRVRAADRPGSAPRDPFQIRDASFSGRDRVERGIATVSRVSTGADFTAFRSCLLLSRRSDATRGWQISRRCALRPRRSGDRRPDRPSVSASGRAPHSAPIREVPRPRLLLRPCSDWERLLGLI